MSADKLCPPQLRDGDWYACGRAALARDPATRRTPSTSADAWTLICWSCLEAWANAEARRKE